MYLEMRCGVRRTHDIVLVPLKDYAERPTRYSFRSVYAYPDETKFTIEQQGTTDGLAETPVYSDTLFVDIDRSVEDVVQFREKLVKLGVGFTQWSTGRRGGHFHIPIEPMFGATVPMDQKTWVKNLAGDGAADLSIYSVNGQWRLPYAVHEKAPGRLKVPVETVAGTKLVIPKSIAPPPVARVMNKKQVTKMTYVSNLTSARGAGGRSPHMYIICCNAVALGIELDELVADLVVWNSRYASPPHEDAYVVNFAEKTYAYLLGTVRRYKDGRQQHHKVSSDDEGSEERRAEPPVPRVFRRP